MKVFKKGLVNHAIQFIYLFLFIISNFSCSLTNSVAIESKNIIDKKISSYRPAVRSFKIDTNCKIISSIEPFVKINQEDFRYDNIFK
jgi:hypothetical protein